ncbi:hypothetical protein ACFY1U_50215, partial [Streptomyces sp. NPDC001351]|uniref:hypothetical protein n=1 Tax=Streptomyces sp. NPDC001351 TaxID=3364564 RepID=UPI003699EC22
ADSRPTPRHRIKNGALSSVRGGARSLVRRHLRLFDALTAAEVISELHLIARQDHEFDTTPRYTQSSARLVVDFLRAQVIEPDQVAKEVLEGNPLASMPPPGGTVGGTTNHA